MREYINKTVLNDGHALGELLKDEIKPGIPAV